MDLALLSRYVNEGLEERVPISAKQELPLLVLPNVVLIPGTVVPLHIAKSIEGRLVDAVLHAGEDVVVSFAPEGRDREPMPSMVCGAGRLIVIEAFSDGRKNIMIEGDYRVELGRVIEDGECLRAESQWVRDIPYPGVADRMLKMRERFLRLVKQWLFLMGHEALPYISVLEMFREPHYLADFIAGYFFPDYTLKQKLLETRECEMRVLIVEEILRKGVDWMSRHPGEGHARGRDRASSCGREWMN